MQPILFAVGIEVFVKTPEKPMNMEDIKIMLVEAAHLSNHRRFVIAGSPTAEPVRA